MCTSSNIITAGLKTCTRQARGVAEDTRQAWGVGEEVARASEVYA
jgi:hypothetical protein